jgi:hypothetical protein
MMFIAAPPSATLGLDGLRSSWQASDKICRKQLKGCADPL